MASTYGPPTKFKLLAEMVTFIFVLGKKFILLVRYQRYEQGVMMCFWWFSTILLNILQEWMLGHCNASCLTIFVQELSVCSIWIPHIYKG